MKPEFVAQIGGMDLAQTPFELAGLHYSRQNCRIRTLVHTFHAAHAGVRHKYRELLRQVEESAPAGTGCRHQTARRELIGFELVFTSMKVGAYDASREIRGNEGSRRWNLRSPMPRWFFVSSAGAKGSGLHFDHFKVSP